MGIVNRRPTRRRDVGFGVLIATIPAVVFVVHDFVFQLPDNEGEASLGFFLSLGGLLCVWYTSGYLLAHGVNRPARRIIAGALAGIVSVAIVWVAFAVLNGLFLERMSYEPDRIRAFQQSGEATLRDWWSHQRGWGPIPVLMSVAAVAGAIGGAARRPTLRREA